MMRRIKNIMFAALMLLVVNCLLVSQNVYALDLVERLMNGWNYLLELFVIWGIFLSALYLLGVVGYEAITDHQFTWGESCPKILFGSWLLVAGLIMVFNDKDFLCENQSESNYSNKPLMTLNPIFPQP